MWDNSREVGRETRAVTLGGRVEGRLNDVSASGAGVCFDSADAPVLAVGQHVDLVFDSGSFAGPLMVAAQVQHRTEAGEGAWTHTSVTTRSNTGP